MKHLEGSFDMPDVSHEYLRDRIVAVWRNFKSDLYTKYVKGKNPTVALSEQNSTNRKKLEAPVCVGRNNMAVIRYNIKVLVDYMEVICLKKEIFVETKQR